MSMSQVTHPGEEHRGCKAHCDYLVHVKSSVTAALGRSLFGRTQVRVLTARTLVLTAARELPPRELPRLHVPLEGWEGDRAYMDDASGCYANKHD